MNFWNKKINSQEFLELRQEILKLKQDVESIRWDFDLVVKKLKIKFKIPNKGEEENINSSVLLPDNNGFT